VNTSFFPQWSTHTLFFGVLFGLLDKASMNGGCILIILGRIGMIAPLIPLGSEDGIEAAHLETVFTNME